MSKFDSAAMSSYYNTSNGPDDRPRPSGHISENHSLRRGTNVWSSRARKRLIVACDGTWQDSTNTSSAQYPSNVTRIVRAISKYGFDNEGREVEQVVYYQKGVGTGLADRLYGGKNCSSGDRCRRVVADWFRCAWLWCLSQCEIGLRLSSPQLR
jgi:hypothetical protein